MVAHKVKIAVLLLLACGIDASVIAPAIAPVASIAYTKAVPYNVLPYANSVNIFSKVLSSPLIAGYAAVPALARSPLGPHPAFAPHPAFSAAVPVAHPAFAPAPVAPVGLRVSSFLPAPFSAAPAPHHLAAPVAGAPSFNSGYLASAIYPNQIHPAYDRSVHAVPNPAIPAVAHAPAW